MPAENDGPHPNEGTDLLSHSHSSESIHHSSSKHLGETVPLYARPRQRQRWNDLQILPHVNWGDLFFDLFYVAAAYNLAVILKHSPTAEGILFFICCYCPISMFWNEKLMYDARYTPEDNLFHRSLEIAYLLFLGTAIQHIRPVELMKNTATYPTTFVFTLSLFFVTYIDMKRLSDVKSNVDGGEEAKRNAHSDWVRNAIHLIAFGSAAVISGRDYFFLDASVANEDESEGDNEDCGNYIPVLLCLLGFVLDTVYTLWENLIYIAQVDFKEHRVPMNIEFTIHRLGEWIMLMLGESVLSLLIVEESAGVRYYVTFYSGMLSVTLMQYLYFRSQPFQAQDHAMRRSGAGGYFFAYSLIVYSASLIIIGCSFKLILHHYLDEEAVAKGGEIEEDEPQFPLEESAQRIANMFSWSMAVSFFTLDMMIISHRGWVSNLSRLYSNGRIHWIPTLVTLLDYTLLAITATFSQWITNLEVLSVAGVLMVIAQVLMRTFGLRFFPVSKNAFEHEQLRWPNTTTPRSISMDQ